MDKFMRFPHLIVCGHKKQIFKANTFYDTLFFCKDFDFLRFFLISIYMIFNLTINIKKSNEIRL